MRFYLSIDDTDNHSSPGSGQLAETLAGKLEEHNLAGQCSSISRHQLYIHESVPYTSHNSSMCFTAETDEHMLNQVIGYSQDFLRENAADGSDPGLCVARKDDFRDRDSLITFGLKAKKSLITKEEAIMLAEQTGVHLSEHGGTGDGIIGALAGTGLRIMGNDGRLRGWLDVGNVGQTVHIQKLLEHPLIDGVIDNNNMPLPTDASIIVTEPRIKTVLHNHLRVIRVKINQKTGTPHWTTLSRAEIKKI